MIILMPSGKPTDGRILVNLSSDAGVFMFGDQEKAQVFDRWIEIDSDDRLWSAWLRNSEGTPTVDGKHVVADVLMPVQHLDKWAADTESEYRATPDREWTVRCRIVANTRHMDKVLYAKLAEDLRSRFKSAIESSAREFPSVAVSLGAQLNQELRDTEIVQLLSDASRNLAQREEAIRVQFKKAWQASHVADLKPETYSFYQSDGSQNQIFLGSHFLRVRATPYREESTIWIGDILDVRLDEMKTVAVGEMRNVKTTVFPAFVHLGSGDGPLFYFAATGDRDRFARSLVLAREGLLKKYAYGFSTEITAPVGFYSESVAVEDVGFFFDGVDRSLPKASLMFTNGSGTELSLGDPLISGTSWKIIRFKSLTDQPIKIRLERFPFKRSDQLQTLLGK